MSPSVQRNQHSKRGGEWSETCIGLWSRSMIGAAAAKSLEKQKSLPVCTGINLIRLRNMEIGSVKPTNTVGIQIIIQDTDTTQNIEENQFSSKNRGSKTVAQQQKMSDLVNYFNTVKEKSNEFSKMLQDLASSEHKLRRIGDIASRKYDHLREWLEQYWK